MISFVRQAVEIRQNPMKTDLEKSSCFIEFDESISGMAMPERFNFPFLYEPHPLCIVAAEQLQRTLLAHRWEHDFGLEVDAKPKAMGKMFGVLLVRDEEDRLGFLAAFSGKMGESSQTGFFVPSIYDRLKVDGHFKKEEAIISKINREIKRLEESEEYNYSKKEWETIKKQMEAKLEKGREIVKAGKKDRRGIRKKAKAELDEHSYKMLLDELARESLLSKFEHRELQRFWERESQEAKQKFDAINDSILQMKEVRKQRSGQLQNFLFEQYVFLNVLGKERGVKEIFAETPLEKPPAGAGDCAAPKLLQYAFKNNLKPLSMAEFWWGKSPNSEIRKHRQFYPACRGKCFPILTHMLEGMDIDEDPTLFHGNTPLTIEVLYEDSELFVINKPQGLLSVPGRKVNDSVYSRMLERYPDCEGPVIVHRLDMSTSGLMVLARNPKAHKALQYQFIHRTIRKRYSAVLEGVPREKEGSIELPLAGDYLNRPCQKVCYDKGKAALTQWKLSRIFQTEESEFALVHFTPVTGRTHQLRVHAAHHQGLNFPIIGDALYGTTSERLYLHAELLEFSHPTTGEAMSFQSSSGFENAFGASS